MRKATGRSFSGSGSEIELEQRHPRINVILNWFEELKQRVPTGR